MGEKLGDAPHICTFGKNRHSLICDRSGLHLPLNGSRDIPARRITIEVEDNVRLQRRAAFGASAARRCWVVIRVYS
jgi:hypothetical protein